MNIKQIILNGLKAGFITKSVNGLSTFLLMYFINNTQGTEFYGSLMIITATALVLSSISNPGVKFVCLREMSVASNRIMKSTWAISGLLFSISIALLLLVIFVLIYRIVGKVDSNIFFGILITPLMVSINYNNYISREYSLKDYTFINIAFPISMLLIYFCIAYQNDLEPFLLVTYACILGCFIQYFFIVYIEKDFIKKIQKDFFVNLPKNFTAIFKKSTRFALGDSISIMASNIFIVLANFFGFNKESIGLYAIAQKTSGILMTLSMQIKTFLMPEMSRLSSQSNIQKINDFGKVISKVSTLITFISCFVSIIILNLFYDNLNLGDSDLTILVGIIIILHTGYMVDAWVGPVGMVARLLGGEYFQNFVMIISLLLSIMIFSLFHSYGLLMLSFVVSAYLVIWNVAVMIWLKIKKNVFFSWGISNEKT
jgi:O-antigen/teichoic acid export membrane protein